MKVDDLAGSDRLARAAWSRLVEPGEPAAAAIIDALGPVGGLAAIEDGAISAAGRLAPRLAELDLDRLFRVAETVSARLVVPGDAEWPDGVASLPVPPVCLWLRGPGHLAGLLGRSVSIVGSRACTPYGLHVAGEAAAGVCERGFTVVSGAALGIDGAAHRGALAAQSPTIAVLAGGVDRAYPTAHSALIDAIAADGVLVAETAPGGAPSRSRFLVRNRLIAAFTGGTVVVEAAVRSGALNTARTAAEIGRPVGAVPGPVTSMMSSGTHQLIRDGIAVLVTDAGEIAELAGSLGRDTVEPLRAAPTLFDEIPDNDRAVLYATPLRSPVAAERIARTTSLEDAAVAAALGRLELSGLVERRGSGWRRTARSR